MGELQAPSDGLLLVLVRDLLSLPKDIVQISKHISLKEYLHYRSLKENF